MAVLFAYISVVLIWATTPLTIQWSSDSLSFIAAVLLRMSIALAIGLLINLVLRRKLFAQPGVWQVYAAGAIGIFPNMPVVYWSAQFIPSGLVAVVFAMSPFVMGLMTLLVLKQNPFSVKRIIAFLLALVGLVVIFHHQLKFDAHAVYGVLGILASCCLFSFSSVLVKKMDVKVNSLNHAIGTLLFSVPCLLLMWLLMDGSIPTHISTKSFVAIGYLSIFGSLVGAALFFYVLAHMSPTAVSLITFITPVLALILGALVAHERLGLQLWVGAGLVVVALLLYVDLSASAWFFRRLANGASHANSLQEAKAAVDKFK